jgi:hypothetical protein
MRLSGGYTPLFDLLHVRAHEGQCHGSTKIELLACDSQQYMQLAPYISCPILSCPAQKRDPNACHATFKAILLSQYLQLNIIIQQPHLLARLERRQSNIRTPIAPERIS